MEKDTLPQLWRRRVHETPDLIAYRWFDEKSQRWEQWSWIEADERVEQWGRALDAEKLSHGDRVAILVPAGIDHVLMDQAALSRGLVPVPMHAVDNPESIVYILSDSGASLLLIDSWDRWQALVGAGARPEALRRVICISSDSATDLDADARVIALTDWLSSGKDGRSAASERAKVEPSDLAALVYTSGTTGRPKGVMLTHRNIVANVKASRKRLTAESSDIFLSFLPLSHTFERTACYYFAIAVGSCVAFARSTSHLPEDLKLIRPTILTSVPRIYERVYARIANRRASAGSLERAMWDLTEKIGWQRFEARQGRQQPLPLGSRFVWPILKRLVADRVLEGFGGRLRVAISGGAPIPEAVIRFFLSMGLDILQGYGMTETSPVVSTNSLEDNDPRTVGRPLDGIEVAIGENEELVVRGPSVMAGYWHRDEETRRVLQADGWLHTGDQARIEAGRILITGRIKDIIVTSTGEKFPPADLEMAIVSDPLFEQAMVIGENRPFVAALVVINSKEWARATAANQGRSEQSILLDRISKAASGFPAYAMPRAVWWTTEPWTVESTLLTPTLKIKRLNIENRFANEIEKLFARRGDPSPLRTAKGGR